MIFRKLGLCLHRYYAFQFQLSAATEFQRYTDAINMANTIRPDPDDDRTMWQLLVMAHPYINAPSAHIGAALLPWHREYCWR